MHFWGGFPFPPSAPLYFKLTKQIKLVILNFAFVYKSSIVFVQLVLNVRLLDYSILLKARHDELIEELITLHSYEAFIRLMAIMRSQLKNEREFFSPPPGE